MSGVPITIPSLPLVTLTGDDQIAVWDTGSGVQGRQLISTLQAYMAATFATLAGGNAFTGNQTISTGTLNVQGVSASYSWSAANRDAGAGQRGAFLVLGTNTNDSTPGTLELICSAGSGGTSVYVWSDDSGNVRVKRGFSSAWPTGATRNSDGVVVGTQTSSLDTKDVVEELSPIEEVLAWVAEGAAAVRRFTYKDGTNNGEEFEGVIVDFAGRYGSDVDEAHPNGKSLNTVNAIGDLLRVVDHQAMQIAELFARVTALEGTQ